MCLQSVRVSRLSRRVDGELQAADCRRSQSCVSAWSCFQGNERGIACFLLLYFFFLFIQFSVFLSFFFVFLFLLFCFQRCVSSSRSNNAGQRTTDHMFHEHTDCSRQGEESSFVSHLRLTFRFSPSVNFFVIACFLFVSLLFTETHTYGSEEIVGFVRLGDVREESSFVWDSAAAAHRGPVVGNRRTSRPTDTKKPTKAAHAS